MITRPVTRAVYEVIRKGYTSRISRNFTTFTDALSQYLQLDNAITLSGDLDIEFDGIPKESTTFDGIRFMGSGGTTFLKLFNVGSSVDDT